MDPYDKHFNKIHDNRIWNGIILIIAGALLLAYKLGANVPHWVWTWQMLLIVLGLLTLLKSGFKKPGGYIMILVGGLFLLDEFYPQLNMHNYVLPAALIGAGIIFILRPKYHVSNRHYNEIYKLKRSAAQGFSSEYADNSFTEKATQEDAEHIDYNAVFGSVKKSILSKNFRGGEINCFMGGAEINFMQADIQLPVVLEINNVFGGTKLIVPGNWDVKSELTAVFGGIEDKRSLSAITPDKNKQLILKGTCVFGGIEIINFGNVNEW